MNIPLFLRNRFPGYKILDFLEWVSDGWIEIKLAARKSKKHCCYRCKTELKDLRSQHKLKLQEMPILNLKVVVTLWRKKGYCSKCKKYRSEAIDFVCPESPHLTAEFGWWLGRLCEISAVSNAADLTGQEAQTLWRHDYNRMRRMLQHYKLPGVTHLSVDEVYARKKKKGEETRSDLFFTVISDLKTGKVVYVTQGRSKEALDEFFILLGAEDCRKIEVVCMDQFDGYKASTEEYCPQATIVWDKFHILQNFEEAINEVRKNLHNSLYKNAELKPLTRGKWRFVFLKKNKARNKTEQEHIQSVVENNQDFYHLELIKECMLEFFNEKTIADAKETFTTIGAWIARMGEKFKPLLKWHDNLENGWSTLTNYFTHPFTTSLSEGINNVIKMLKRRAFGYRNMHYFRLKIMQKCGYLNSKFIDLNFQGSN